MLWQGCHNWHSCFNNLTLLFKMADTTRDLATYVDKPNQAADDINRVVIDDTHNKTHTVEWYAAWDIKWRWKSVTVVTHCWLWCVRNMFMRYHLWGWWATMGVCSVGCPNKLLTNELVGWWSKMHQHCYNADAILRIRTRPYQDCKTTVVIIQLRWHHNNCRFSLKLSTSYASGSSAKGNISPFPPRNAASKPDVFLPHMGTKMWENASGRLYKCNCMLTISKTIDLNKIAPWRPH